MNGCSFLHHWNRDIVHETIFGPTLVLQWYLMLDLDWSNAGMMMVSQHCANIDLLDKTRLAQHWPNVGMLPGINELRPSHRSGILQKQILDRPTFMTSGIPAWPVFNTLAAPASFSDLFQPELAMAEKYLYEIYLCGSVSVCGTSETALWTRLFRAAHLVGQCQAQ